MNEPEVTRPSDHVTWAEVHELQDQAERLEMVAHISDVHYQRYQMAFRKVIAARTALEQRKRYQQQQLKKILRADRTYPPVAS